MGARSKEEGGHETYICLVTDIHTVTGSYKCPQVTLDQAMTAPMLSYRVFMQRTLGCQPTCASNAKHSLYATHHVYCLAFAQYTPTTIADGLTPVRISRCPARCLADDAEEDSFAVLARKHSFIMVLLYLRTQGTALQVGVARWRGRWLP